MGKPLMNNGMSVRTSDLRLGAFADKRTGGVSHLVLPTGTSLCTGHKLKSKFSASRGPIVSSNIECEKCRVKFSEALEREKMGRKGRELIGKSFKLFGIRKETLLKGSQESKFVTMRHAMCYVLYFKLGLTYRAIAGLMGMKTHAGAYSAVSRAVCRVNEKDQSMDMTIKKIESELDNPTVWMGAAEIPVDFEKTLIG